MKKLIGRKSVLMCLVGMMVILLGATAQAALMITGGISFSGDVELLDVELEPTYNASTATNFSFSNVVVQSGSGTYLGVPKDTDANFTGFDFTSNSDVTPLWYFTSGLVDYSMDASGTTMILTRLGGDIPYVIVTGQGTLFATGFESTAGFFGITAQQGDTTFSFSSSAKAAAVPEPTTLILLGSGLLGLALTGAKKKFRK